MCAPPWEQLCWSKVLQVVFDSPPALAVGAVRNEWNIHARVLRSFRIPFPCVRLSTMPVSVSAGVLSAAIKSQYRDGSTLNVFLQVTLPAGFCPRNGFRELSDAVRSATQSRHSDWRKDGPELWISVSSPDPETDDKKNMVSNAVCEGTNRIVIPRASINWTTRS